MTNKKIINEFADKFIVVEGSKLIFKSDYGEFEKWISGLLAAQRQEIKEMIEGKRKRMKPYLFSKDSKKELMALPDYQLEDIIKKL